MKPTEPTVCDVAGCGARSTGSYLDASRATPLRFAICDFHVAQLRNGGRPVVLDGRSGQPPVLLVQ